jgi:queuine tRNA-ribosyltransferase
MSARSNEKDMPPQNEASGNESAFPEHEVVVTRGGARAMLDRTTGEVMHPIVGPVIEAPRLYTTPSRLAARLAVADPAPLVLFDVGLGAGSNAIAAWHLSEALPETARRLSIVSFDRTTEALELAARPEHASAFDLESGAACAVHTLIAERRHESRRTTWRLVLGELPSALTLGAEQEAMADIVFWDPFSPRANPELWTFSAFARLRRLCRGNATVHTYSGATATRSALLLAGFAVGTGEPCNPSRPTKLTTIAAVDVADLERPLDARWLERLRRSSAPFPVDARPDALDRIASLPQFASRASRASRASG